jgi:NAD-dependent dihydropyrimidine dehydrogenase PreA subunit
MQTVFTSKLKPFLDAVAKQMELYVPKKAGQHYIYSKYDFAVEAPVEFNNIRTCVPAKEFLFPLREPAATFPCPVKSDDIKPFAVFGLKDCDLRSIEILDEVFADEEFRDPFYVSLREKMFIISSDCTEPGESCFCNVFDGQGFSRSGFDLNVSKIKDGFIIDVGSQKGKGFIEKQSHLFADIPKALLAERDKNRTHTKNQLEQNNAEFRFDAPIKEIMENSQDSDIFYVEAQNCVECQACTRVCPTCHCFYLYDTKQKDYFAKMKMWDSCMRIGYAAVAGGANPHKILGDRIKHRFMHKFVYFLERYGRDMCVGCGRCIDADAGGMDIRVILRKLGEEFKSKKEVKIEK